MKTPANPMVEAQAQLALAEEQRQKRNFDRARKVCEKLIRRFPNYVGAHHTLGLVQADSGDFVGALTSLIQASMLNPRDWRTLTALSGVYLKLGSSVMAARTLEDALKSKPHDVNTLATLAEIYDEEEEYELAAETYKKIVEIEPSLTPAQVGLGEAYMHLGNFSEAAAVFEGLFHAGVQSLRVCYHLGQLPKQLSNINYLPIIEKISKEKAPEKNDNGSFESALAFARATALDRIGKYPEAWEQLIVGNQLKFEQFKSKYDKKCEFNQRILSYLKRDSTKPKIDLEFQKDVPKTLFILGTSRSGKTTMERLVASLDGVKRGYETAICDNVTRRVFQSSGLLTHDLMSAIGAPMYPLYREYYMEELKERTEGAELFTITIPGHIIDAFASAKVIPNARLIFVKRNVDDVALRIFMKSYERGSNVYAYAIKTIDEHVRWYNEIIDLCVERLPGVARVLQYEDLIEDPEKALEIAADLCEMPVSRISIPDLGDDRGCSAPYKDFIQDARNS